jgi:LmbE family N-acetylglucosaminyl deacetylase
MQEAHILAVGAHCGDMEVSAGMIVAKMARLGRRTAFLHLTPGEKGHPTLDPDAYADVKRREAVAAAERFGGEAMFLPYRDGELPDTDEVKFAIADVIRAVKPKIILAHWPGSIHKDHSAAGRVMPDAQFYAAISGFRRELPAHGGVSMYYTENWEDPHDFRGEIAVEVEEQDIEVWEAACREYGLLRGDWPTFAYLDYYRSLARVRGLERFSRTGYAQCLGLTEWAKRKRVSEL